MNLMSINGCHAFPCKYGHGLELFIQTWNLCDQKKKKQPVRLVIPSRFCMQNMERVGFQSLVQKVLSGPILDQSQLGNGLRPKMSRASKRIGILSKTSEGRNKYESTSTLLLFLLKDFECIRNYIVVRLYVLFIFLMFASSKW